MSDLHTLSTTLTKRESFTDLQSHFDAREIVAEHWGQGRRSGKVVKYCARWRSDDDSASFAVYANGFKDYGGSGEHGDLLTFLQRENGWTLIQAADYLRARTAGAAALPYRHRQAPQQPSPNEPPSTEWQTAARSEAVEATERNLWANNQALNYLRYVRGLSDETIRRYRLGYNSAWRDLSYRDPDTNKRIGLAPGITIPYESDGAIWAIRVRRRVGNLAEALGIKADTNGDGKVANKYINLAGAGGRKPLFNFDGLRPGIDVMFVEGEFDAMLAKQELGEGVTVVTYGASSNTPEHIPARQRERLLEAGHVCLAMDNDQAGSEGAKRLIAALTEIGKTPTLYPVPIGKDITEYVIDHNGDLRAWWKARGSLTLWEHAPFLVCDLGEYILIERHARALGTQDGFTTEQIATSAGISADTAQRWIDKCLNWKAISECPSAELQGIETNPTIPCKNADGRDSHGRFASTHYRLTPQGAQDMIAYRLPGYVQELMDRGEADIIRRDETTEAGFDADRAAALELTTRAIAQTVEAFEVSAHDEREAVQKARELQRMAEYDLTPFKPDYDAASVTELRAQLIGALIATAPDEVWQHNKLMWIAGVKKASVSALIKKSAYMPALMPTFIDVPLNGDDAHRAVRAACAKHRGAPVAWLDAQGDVLDNFGHEVPEGTKAARLNLGKKYILRSAAPAVVSEPAPPTREIEAAEPAPPDPVEIIKVRARRGMLPRLRGCLRARGWHYVGGAFGYWERGNQTSATTCEDMIAALLLDYEWARAARAKRQADDLTGFAESLGAVVKVKVLA